MQSSGLERRRWHSWVTALIQFLPLNTLIVSWQDDLIWSVPTLSKGGDCLFPRGLTEDISSCPGDWQAWRWVITELSVFSSQTKADIPNSGSGTSSHLPDTSRLKFLGELNCYPLIISCPASDVLHETDCWVSQARWHKKVWSLGACHERTRWAGPLEGELLFIFNGRLSSTISTGRDVVMSRKEFWAEQQWGCCGWRSLYFVGGSHARQGQHSCKSWHFSLLKTTCPGSEGAGETQWFRGNHLRGGVRNVELSSLSSLLSSQLWWKLVTTWQHKPGRRTGDCEVELSEGEMRDNGNICYCQPPVTSSQSSD